MISAIISRLVIMVFGTLYPAYASYKAVKTKNVKEYVKWMMYWIVFALFSCAETFTDVFLSWLPFYYEIKIILVVWLLSPATKGSSILYRKFVHPTLSSKEQEIDEYITKAKEQSYKQFLDLGTKGVSALMQTAIKGGGGIVQQLRKSYSLSDLSDPGHDDVDNRDETDIIITDPRLIRRRQQHQQQQRSPNRPVSSASTTSLYFSEIDVLHNDRIAHVQSVDDISSGYSSGEGLLTTKREGLLRTGSLTRASRTTRVTRSTVLPKKASISEESDDSEVFDTNVIFSNDQTVNQQNSSEEEFVDSLDTLHDDSKQLTACNDRDDKKNEDFKRGGKYHKKIAPKPPETNKQQLENEQLSTIKAKLVLKPGVVRPVETPNAECKEIFLQSPKLKRKSTMKPIINLINFPISNKLSNKLKLINSKLQSRSANDLSAKQSNNENCSGSQVSINTLIESPLAKRRLKIIRRYVDEDID